MKRFFIIMTTFMILYIWSMSHTLANTDNGPSIISEAAVVIEAETGAVLYEKNADVEMYPASFTKIATAIYAIENGNLDDIVTVSSNARSVEGTRVYLEEGEQVKLKKLLQGLLINSGNDAGVAIAEHLSGSVEQFANDLNEFLQTQVGVMDTNFENPHGLFDPEHVTTAKDLAKITQYAIQNEQFKEIFGTKQLEWDGESWDTTLYNHHRILRGEYPYEGVTGGKNGFVSESGFTLATLAERENLDLIVVTFKASYESEAYNDTIKLLDYGFENFTNASIAEGTTFEVAEKEFITPSALSYTYFNEDEVSPSVHSDGTLEIVNQENEVVAAFQLEELVDEKETAMAAINRVTEEVISEPVAKKSFNVFIVFALVVAFGIAGVIYRQMRRI